MPKTFITSLMVFTAFQAYAEVKETKFIKDALQNTKAEDIIILDIDNTILEPMQTLGSDQWFGYLVKKFRKEGLSQDRAIDEAIKNWLKVQRVTKVQPVEISTPKLIKSVQLKGAIVIGLTARPVDLKKTTIKQLKSVNIQFKSYGFIYSGDQTVDFHGGVLFVGPKNNKGIILSQFFKNMGIKPKRLIFVDDKKKHVNNMDEVFSKIGLTNINFRYSAADEKVKSFSQEIAEIQWKYFTNSQESLITDEEAEQLIDN